ncbi:MAG: helix-turn-helix domain-containing protein [Erysipelotrichaceae bacterium]
MNNLHVIRKQRIFEFPTESYNYPCRCFLNYVNEEQNSHFHREIQFILVLKGSVKIVYQNSVSELGENDIEIIDRGVAHAIIASKDSVRATLIFHTKVFNDVLPAANMDLNLRELFNVVSKNSNFWSQSTIERISEIILEILAEYKTKKYGYLFVMKSNLCKLLTIILRELPRSDYNYRNKIEVAKHSEYILEKLSELADYLEDNYHQDITITHLADKIGYSTTYTSKFFKKWFGTNFTKFLNSYRIEQAKFLLANENLTIPQVMERAGFNNSKTFYRQFKKSVGYAPLEYKKYIKGL